jgi:hypothetical protein
MPVILATGAQRSGVSQFKDSPRQNPIVKISNTKKGLVEWFK